MKKKFVMTLVLCAALLVPASAFAAEKPAATFVCPNGNPACNQNGACPANGQCQTTDQDQSSAHTGHDGTNRQHNGTGHRSSGHGSQTGGHHGGDHRR